MQLLGIDTKTKLSDLIQSIGRTATATMLASNGLSWEPNVGSAFADKCSHIASKAQDVSIQRKVSLLNSVTSDSDIFESLSLAGESTWKIFSELGTLPGSLRVPDGIILPDNVNILGNGEHVSSTIYNKAMKSLKNEPHRVDPAIFNNYSTKNINTKEYNVQTGSGDPFMMFRIPWGDLTLYSSLSGDSVDFPVYPEELSDAVKANYTTMPDLLFQYEPWQIYNSSGPRSVSLSFHMHRDMWTGDHQDGKCNQLIRFCEAQCYPEFNGSAVNTSTVTMYIKGKKYVTGVMTDVSTDWGGPIGNDGFYLECTLKITITEVSEQPLNYSTMKNKGLIG